MAIVIHEGKRYKLFPPLTVGAYLVTRYGPLPDENGFLEPNDLLVFVEETNSGITVEADGEDARLLVPDILAYEDGSLSEVTFIGKLDDWYSDSMKMVGDFANDLD
jgi:hypothetical protein